MADQLVTPSELIVRLNLPADQEPMDRATQAVENATGHLQSATGQRFVAAAGDVFTTRARPNQWRLWLPERPVTAVTAVTVDGVAKIVNVDWYLDGASLVATNTSWYGSGTWPATVAVTYSHGYATVPQALKDECLRLAVMLYENPGALRSASVGGESAVWAGDLTAGFAVSSHILAAYGSLAVA